MENIWIDDSKIDQSKDDKMINDQIKYDQMINRQFLVMFLFLDILANSDPPGRNKQIPENEEEIKVFYCLALKNEEEIRKRWGKK